MFFGLTNIINSISKYQRKSIISTLIVLIFVFSLLGGLITSNSLSVQDDSKYTFIEEQTAAGGKIWYTEVVGVGEADSLGIGSNDMIIVQDGCSLIERDNGNWTSHTVSPCGTRDFFVDGTTAYMAADGPDGSASPYQ